MTLTQKAIFIDEELKKEVYDENQVFKYIQEIVYVLAIKKRYFIEREDYEDYSYEAASMIYHRIHRSKTETHLKPIKSILNYIKATMYGIKDKYSQKYFRGIINIDRFKEPLAVRESLVDYISTPAQSMLQERNLILLKDYLESFPKVIARVVKESKYATDEISYDNLYISALLSFLNNFSFTYDQIKKLKESYETQTTKKKLNIAHNNFLQQFRTESMQQPPKRFNIDEEQHIQLSLMIVRIRDMLKKDLLSLTADDYISEDMMTQILNETLYDELEDYNE